MFLFWECRTMEPRWKNHVSHSPNSTFQRGPVIRVPVTAFGIKILSFWNQLKNYKMIWVFPWAISGYIQLWHLAVKWLASYPIIWWHYPITCWHHMILWVNKLVNNNYLNQRVLIRCSHPESTHWDHTWLTPCPTRFALVAPLSNQKFYVTGYTADNHLTLNQQPVRHGK